MNKEEIFMERQKHLEEIENLRDKKHWDELERDNQSIIAFLLALLLFFGIFLFFRFFTVCVQKWHECNMQKTMWFERQCPPCTIKRLLYLED
jgi:hypothetical protein